MVEHSLTVVVTDEIDSYWADVYHLSEGTILNGCLDSEENFIFNVKGNKNSEIGMLRTNEFKILESTNPKEIDWI